jgi:hypothetical protein
VNQDFGADAVDLGLYPAIGMLWPMVGCPDLRRLWNSSSIVRVVAKFWFSGGCNSLQDVRNQASKTATKDDLIVAIAL